MEMEKRTCVRPGLLLVAFVLGIVVEEQMQIWGRDTPDPLAQEGQNFLFSVSSLAGGVDLPLAEVQGLEQGEGAMAPIAMGVGGSRP